MNQQRKSIYKLRRRVLAAGAGTPLVEYEENVKTKKKIRVETSVTWEQARERVLDLLEESIFSSCDAFAGARSPAGWDLEGLENALKDQFGASMHLVNGSFTTREDLEEQIWNVLLKRYEQKEEEAGKDQFRRLEQYIYLSTIDALWKDHLLAMDHLRQGIGLRGYGQKDPKQEYKKEGYQMFVQMMQAITTNVVSALLRMELRREEPRPEPRPEPRGEPRPERHPEDRAGARSVIAGEFDLSKKRLPKMNETRGEMLAGGAPAPGKQQTVRGGGPKARPNDPCPCGSGKKFKRCHGLEAA
jgi:preprotein translocase subunit SecA